MVDALRMTSQLAASAWIDLPSDPHPIDPVLRWDQCFDAEREAVAVGDAIPLKTLTDHLEGLFPEALNDAPKLLERRHVLWIAGAGALFDGQTGLAVPGSMLTRFPRHRQTPYSHTHWLELTRPMDSFHAIDEVLWLPHAACDMFGHWMTEILAFLWPLLLDGGQDLTGWPVLLPGCDAGQPLAETLFQLLRRRHLSPLLPADCPKALYLRRVLIPEPSLRLHAGTSPAHYQAAQALGDWLVQSAESQPLSAARRVFLSRSALTEECRKVEGERDLEDCLRAQGWTVVHPQQHPLAEQVALLRSAEWIAAFDGSALHGLAWLGLKPKSRVIMLGDRPSLDYWLQFRCQGIQGWFVPCTLPIDDGQPAHLQHRQLLMNPAGLAQRVDDLCREDP